MYNPNPSKQETGQAQPNPMETGTNDVFDDIVDNAIFELRGIKHEVIVNYNPTFLAKGGEHIIYDIAGHPDIVVKVATEPLKRMADWNITHGQAMDFLSPEAESDARAYIKVEAARYQQLKKYFGSKHVPGQRQFLVKVPITENILNALYDGKAPATATEVWVVATAQQRVGELDDPEREALVMNYAELEDIAPEAYDRVTAHLVFNENPDHPLEKDEFLEVQSHHDLNALMRRADSDKNLQESLKGFIEKLISYTQDTGEIFDLAGADNIIFSPKDHLWSYILVDTRYPGKRDMVTQTKTVLSKLYAGAEVDQNEKNILLNMFNFVRTINGLAEQLGIQERITVVSENTARKAMDFFHILREGYL